MQLGMNLARPAHWLFAQPFIDHLKTAVTWTKGAQLNDQGYPIAPEKPGGSVATSFAMSDVPEEYVIRWAGAKAAKPKLTKNFTNVRTVAPGEIRATSHALPGTPSNGLMIYGLDPADPLEWIVVFQARHEAAFEAGQKVNPDWVERHKDEDALRFMDWQQINDNGPDAPLPQMGQCSWATGVPIEVCVEAAELCDATPWVNMPSSIIGNKAAVLAFLDKLPPGEHVRVEPINEDWNTGFRQGKEALAAGGGTSSGHASYVGTMMGELAVLTGSTGRKLSVGWRPSTGAKTWDVWEKAWLAAGGNGKNSRFMTTGYVYGGLNSSKGINPYVEADDIAGAIAALDRDVPITAFGKYDNARAIAIRHGTEWDCYETNFHVNFPAGNKAAIPFSDRLHSDPRIGPVFHRMLSGAAARGCSLNMIFNDCSLATAYGVYGVYGRPAGNIVRAANMLARAGVRLYP